MKKIAAIFAGASLLAGLPALAQDTAAAAAEAAAKQDAEERYKRLNASIEELIAAQAAIQKKIAALTDELRAVRDEASRTTGTAASRDDLRKLAETVAELERQRQADKEVILAEIKKLAKVPVAPPPRVPVTEPKTNPDSVPGVPDKGYEYVVRENDTLSGIVSEYRKKGVKVTVELVQKANPKLDPNRMRVGQKIFIPLPE